MNTNFSDVESQNRTLSLLWKLHKQFYYSAYLQAPFRHSGKAVKGAGSKECVGGGRYTCVCVHARNFLSVGHQNYFKPRKITQFCCTIKNQCLRE